jgi:hypothetical protein
MPITITTLNNEAAAAKTFSEMGKDRVSAQWVNTDDLSSVFTGELTIKQQKLGKGPNGVPVNRCLISYQIRSIGTVTNTDPAETFTINVTLTGPTVLGALTDTQRNDALAYLRNFLTAAQMARLLRGEV